jgi:hypothetical protein
MCVQAIPSQWRIVATSWSGWRSPTAQQSLAPVQYMDFNVEGIGGKAMPGMVGGATAVQCVPSQ